MQAGFCDGNWRRDQPPIELASVGSEAARSGRQRRGGAPPAGLPCPGMEPLLRAFAQGMLDPARVELVDDHLSGCASCQEGLMELLPEARSVDTWNALWAMTSSSTFAPGALVGARYLIRGVLGRGGMGEVYEALDTWLSEPVAIKTLVATDSDSLLALDRLIAEARLARRVAHPNVCRTFDIGLHEGSPESGERLAFITMELIEGEPLGKHLLRHGRLSAEAVERVGVQVLRGLSALHRADLIHRDIKCNNVLLCTKSSAQRSAVIVDFGLAVERNAAPSRAEPGASSCREGTIAYMAPEQLAGDRVTPATDVYGFGATLFEMLTGRSPFASVPPGLRCYPDPAAIELLRGVSCSRPLAVFLERCLRPDPAGRFPDACAALSSFRAIW